MPELHLDVGFARIAAFDRSGRFEAFVGIGRNARYVRDHLGWGNVGVRTTGSGGIGSQGSPDALDEFLGGNQGNLESARAVVFRNSS
jgi:hypothetical protein